MHAALVQFAPVWGNRAVNIEKANSLMLGIRPTDISIVCLPEMAFTGYEFQKKDDIVPFLEVAGEGPTSDFCRQHASRLNSLVCCGYPEVATTASGENKYYNSMIVIDAQGEIIANVRKHFLYKTDKVWATEGSEFCSIYYKPLDRQLGFGICMDINPYEFEAPFHAYEFASFHKEQGSDIIIFCSAWTDSEEESDDPFSTINYWAVRLKPLMEPDSKKCVFICSDRIGKENGTTFVGCSCAISLGDRKLLGNLGKRDEGVLVVCID